VTEFLSTICKAPFTRYNLLSNRLSNRFDNRVNVCIHDTTGCQTGCTTWFDNRLNEQLFVHGCQTGFTTGLRTGWMFVYTIQPVVKPVVQPVWQQVVSCKWGITTNQALTDRRVVVVLTIRRPVLYTTTKAVLHVHVYIPGESTSKGIVQALFHICLLSIPLGTRSSAPCHCWVCYIVRHSDKRHCHIR